jgi:NADPH-dependent 2,4-dienoyl-CoA reductase/sulfur reductase-like enzyme
VIAQPAVGVIVVGGSIGGARTVQQLRRSGYAGSVAIVEREAHLPYDRPPLSKAVLETGTHEPPTLISATQAVELEAELILGKAATGLDLDHRLLQLDDGSTLRYRDALVVATGARARRSPWSDLAHVHELRGWDDACALRSALDEAQGVVVVGAGFIGAEVASAARKRGLQVDLVDVAAIPMGRHFGPDVGSLFVDLHLAHGVRTHFGTGVAELESTDDGVRVVLDDGSTILADLAVVGLGTELNTDWLNSSGVLVEDGVICDQGGRADASAAVFAIGDAARWWDPGSDGMVRYEHWTNAVEQAAVVAHNIAHPDSPKAHRPGGYVWSNQYDWKIQISGNPAVGVRHELVRGAPDRLVVLWADIGDKLCGVLTVNWPQLSMRGRQSLTAGHDLAATKALMFPKEASLAEPPRVRGEAG